MSEIQEQSKPFYLSKTLWVNLMGVIAIVVAQFSPEASSFISEYFAELGSAWSAINVVLRLVSKDKLYLS
jgi:hypothetical protein